MKTGVGLFLFCWMTVSVAVAGSCPKCGGSGNNFCESCGAKITIGHAEMLVGHTDYYFAVGLMSPTVALPIWHTTGGRMNGIMKLKGISIGVLGNGYQSADGIMLGAMNFVESQASVGTMRGLQLGAFWNMGFGTVEVDGFQIASACNLATTVCGCQIGIVNYCENLYGIQIGVINIHKNGPLGFFPGINVGW